MNIICFHNPNEENGYLSNWYPSEFEVSGITYTSAEQYMMYKKAVLFHDSASAKKIRNSRNPKDIKTFGRLVTGYAEPVWNGVRQIIVYEGLLAKFSQNPELYAFLLNTGDSLLAECAVKDKIWGIGLSMQDPDRFDQTKWSGQNLMGYTLMMVRDRLHGNCIINKPDLSIYSDCK